MDKKTMKEINLKMSASMAAIISFVMSLVENIRSGRFDFLMFLITFIVSFLISFLIGLIVPMKKLGDLATAKLKNPKGFLAHCIESLISDFIYTPILSLCMVTLVKNMVPILASSNAANGARLSGSDTESVNMIKEQVFQQAVDSFPPLWKMYLSSIWLCLIIGFVLVLIFQPLILKQLMKSVMPKKPAGGRPEPKELSSDREIF